MSIRNAVRAKPGAPVSTPLDWSEIKRTPDSTSFTLKSVLKRVEKKATCSGRC